MATNRCSTMSSSFVCIPTRPLPPRRWERYIESGESQLGVKVIELLLNRSERHAGLFQRRHGIVLSQLLQCFLQRYVCLFCEKTCARDPAELLVLFLDQFPQFFFIDFENIRRHGCNN